MKDKYTAVLLKPDRRGNCHIMFASQIRKRASLESLIPILTPPSPAGLGLKGKGFTTTNFGFDSRLLLERPMNTADIMVDGCEFLVLTPSCAVSTESLDAALRRIERLIGRQRAAALFLLSTSPNESHQPTIVPTTAPTTAPSTGLLPGNPGEHADGPNAFSKLTYACSMYRLVSSVPLLPVPAISSLPTVVRSFLDSLGRAVPSATNEHYPGHLVRFCTTSAEGEMRKSDFMTLMDEWSNMKDFVRGALAGGEEGLRRVIDPAQTEYMPDCRGGMAYKRESEGERSARGIWEFWV